MYLQDIISSKITEMGNELNMGYPDVVNGNDERPGLRYLLGRGGCTGSPDNKDKSYAQIIC